MINKVTIKIWNGNIKHTVEGRVKKSAKVKCVPQTKNGNALRSKACLVGEYDKQAVVFGVHWVSVRVQVEATNRGREKKRSQNYGIDKRLILHQTTQPSVKLYRHRYIPKKSWRNQSISLNLLILKLIIRHALMEIISQQIILNSVIMPKLPAPNLKPYQNLILKPYPPTQTHRLIHG